MHVRFTAENVFLATRQYENWAEVVTLIAKRQDFHKVILKNGFRIESPTGLKYLMHDIFFRKLYNPTPLHIGSNDIVVDIGAHHGVFAFFAASRTQNTVYAFEPSPGNFKVLEQNIRVNGLNNLIAYNAAVSDEVGSTKFFLDPINNQGHLIAAHLLPDQLAKYRHGTGHLQFAHLVPDPDTLEKYTEVEVPTTTLQAFMDKNNLDRIDFLKMDCEGSEGPILHATPIKYLKSVRKIAMEFHDHLSQFNHDDIQNLLEDVGFTIRLRWDTLSPIGFIFGWRV